MDWRVTDSKPAYAARPAPAPDALSEALAAPLLEPVVAALDLGEALAQSNELVEETGRGDFTPWALARAIALATQFPGAVQLQVNVGKIVAITGDEVATLQCWRRMLERFPLSPFVLPRYAWSLAKHHGADMAREIISGYLPDSETINEPDIALLAARSLAGLGDVEDAIALLERFAQPGRARPGLFRELAKMYTTRGDYARAIAVLDRAGEHPAAGADRRRIAEIEALLGDTDRHAHGERPSVMALAKLLGQIRARRTSGRVGRIRAALGPVVLIGGTLGGGGAERQLANTALGLEARRAGAVPIGPVSVYCRKLDTRRAHDFYLPRLEAAGVHVVDYLRAEPYGGDPAASRVADILPLLELLPPRMREGVAQLTELLRYHAPDVVQIWQDGMILAAGLAALLADVPRIVLAVRTMPPNARIDRQRPEQDLLYRGLLSLPGVVLTANSSAAAKAYEHWLGMPHGGVLVVPNGVDPLPVIASAEEEARWQAFDERTGGGFTLGGVMRFDDNKRPLDWLAIAAALARRRPEARFVLAGAGPLRAAAEDFARRNGILDRTLFVGRSAHIGFWLEKFDALALTSHHEGTPNVLIEAQLAGVPVVTTPAGGAPEATAPHGANLVLKTADHVDHGDAAAHLATLADRREGDIAAAGAALREWAERHFATELMIARTIDIFTAPSSAPLIALD